MVQCKYNGVVHFSYPLAFEQGMGEAYKIKIGPQEGFIKSLLGLYIKTQVSPTVLRSVMSLVATVTHTGFLLPTFSAASQGVLLAKPRTRLAARLRQGKVRMLR